MTRGSAPFTTLATVAPGTLSKGLLAALLLGWLGCTEEQGEPLGFAQASTQHALGVSVTAGARALPSLSYLSSAGTGCTGYVSSSDTWKTVSDAVRNLQPGQVACVRPGTYLENINFDSLGAANGQATAPIVIRAADPLNKPIIRSNANSPVMVVTRSYWIIDGFNIDMNSKNNSIVRIVGSSTAPVSHVTLRNSDIHGAFGASATGGVLIYGNASDIFLYGNSIRDNRRETSTGERDDFHAIFIGPDASKILAKYNTLYDNSGDGVQCQGVAEYGSGTTDPVDITLEDNRIYTTTANQGETENAVDIKSCHYISIRGVLPKDTGSDGQPGKDNNKFYGFRPTINSGSNTAKGEAIVLHYGASDVLVEGTRIWDVCTAVSVGRSETSPTTQSIAIRRNAIFNGASVGTNCSGDGIRIARANQLDIYHNTIDNVARSAIRVGPDNSTSLLITDVDLWNNVIRSADYWLDINTSKVTNFESGYNVFWNSSTDLNNFRINGGNLSLSSWQGFQDGTNIVMADPSPQSFVQDPLFLSGAGSTEDYCTQTGSPLRNAASTQDGSGQFACNGGKDIGFLETDCSACPDNGL